MDMYTAVFLIFTALKLVGVIDWSWWWVCSPLLLKGLLIVVCIMAGLAESLFDEYLKDRKG